ncbi:MAG: DUF885 domain-containing protein [Steroidobacteraceae bacterium]
MSGSRREFLFNSAALLAAGAISPAVAAPPTANQRLEKLFDSLFERVLEISPQLAVTLGRDSGTLSQSRMRLDDETPDGQARRRRTITDVLTDLRKFDPAGLSLRGRLDYEAVLFSTRAEAIARERFACGRVDRRISPYVVSHLAGSYLDAPEFLSSKRPAPDSNETEVYVARLRDFARNLDGESERIRHDASAGVVPPQFILERTLSRMRSQQDKLATRSILESVRDPSAAARDTLDKEVLPRLVQQIALLESLRTRALHDGGLSRLKNCEDCYSAALRVGATTEPNVPEFKRQGIAEVHDLHARADGLLRKVGLKRGPVGERLRSLATIERYLYPDSDAGKARAVADMNARIRSILPALQSLFKTAINANIEVRRLTADEELAGRTGYRVAPSADGARPGVYFIDLHAIRTRPTWSLASVTYHETVPGHLLQLPVQEAAKLHPLRQQLNPRGYSEGWAIYAETLAQRIGVYGDDPLSEIGYLQSRLFRVARMLVDTEIHVSGCSRTQAIHRLMELTAQPPALCEADVDRYFVQPGMIGGDEIGYYAWRTAHAKACEGAAPKYDIGSFHEQALKFGPLPQALLERALFANSDKA